MSVQAMSWVIEHSPHKGSELLCLIMIANHARSDGSGAYPSARLLARECRMSERQVVRLVHRLEASGAVSIEHGAGPRGTHLMTVVMGPAAPMLEEPVALATDKMSDDSPKASDKITEHKAPQSEKLSPDRMAGGDKSTKKGLTNPRQGGDIATSPKPSLRTVTKNRQGDTRCGAETRQPSVPYRMLESLCEVLGRDPRALDPDFVKQQCGIAKKLESRGFTPEDVAACTRYVASQRERWRDALIDLKVIASVIGVWHMNGRPEREPERASPNGRARASPDYSGIDEFSRRMDALEAKGGLGGTRDF